MQIMVSILGALLVLVILAIPSYGYYRELLIPGQDPVVRVNDTVVTMDHYVTRLRLRQGQVEAMGGQSFNFAVEPMELLYGMVDDELIRQGALKLGAIPTPEEITEQKLQIARTGVSGEQYAEVAIAMAFRQKMQARLEAQLPAEAEQVHLWGVLVGTEEEAKAVRDRLERDEDPGLLARELSIDSKSKEAGGDLGWLPRGVREKDFEEAIFSLEVGALSQPIKTLDGLWVVRLPEKEQRRSISEDNMRELKKNVLRRWLNEQRESNQVELYWNSDKYAKAAELLRRKRLPFF